MRSMSPAPARVLSPLRSPGCARRLGRETKDEVTLRALEREAGASRALLENFLARSKETGSQEGFQQADATVISRADVPETPSYPRRKLLLIAAVAGAGFLGLMLALGVEMLDHGFRSMEQIERYMGAPPLGLVPKIEGLAKLRCGPDTQVLEKPTSAYAEAIRSLYIGLVLSGGEQRPRPSWLHPLYRGRARPPSLCRWCKCWPVPGTALC